MCAPAYGTRNADELGVDVGRPRDEESRHRLPAWRDVLAVVAHPDDESFGLGALLSSFVADGSHVSVLCLTHGEASTLHGVAGDLAVIRARELHEAASLLGISRASLAAFPDGALPSVQLTTLVAEIATFVGTTQPDGVVVFDEDGVTGHADHRRATEAALAFAAKDNLPVLGWALPASVASQLNTEFDSAFSGRDASELDLRVEVDRGPQRSAIASHRSQALPGQALWRRLDLTGAFEHARWLSRRDPGAALRPRDAGGSGGPPQGGADAGPTGMRL